MILAGVSGSVPYAPIRVLGQFGIRQVIPINDILERDIILEFTKYDMTMECICKHYWTSSRKELPVLEYTKEPSCDPAYTVWCLNPEDPTLPVSALMSLTINITQYSKQEE
uniref:Uncharacterized protein n=1 Tax=Nelumbo nucifera TaxID=4432 RepID=A0A822XQW0_NELNU|nr:TPA_asm: hypothetical protein HUJ06_022598 [Nelumbo nucifera]